MSTAVRFTVNGTNTQMPVANMATQSTADLLNTPANTFISQSEGLTNLKNTASNFITGVTSATSPLTTGALANAQSIVDSAKAAANTVNSSAVSTTVKSLQSSLADKQKAIATSVAGMSASFKSLPGISTLTSIASVAGLNSIGGLKNLVSGRITKDSFSNSIVVGAGANGLLTNFSSGLAKDNQAASNLLKQISPACQSLMLANFNSSTMPSKTASCGNGSSNTSTIAGCNLNQMAQLVAAAGGGAYAPTVINPGINNASLAALIGGGYKSGLCGVFKNMVANVGTLNDVASVASKVVGASIAGKDLTTILDVGKSMSKGASVSSMLPNIASTAFGMYKSNTGETNASLAASGLSLVSGIGGLIPNWNKSKDGTTLSSSNMGGPKADNSKDVSDAVKSTTAVTDPGAAVASFVLDQPTQAPVMDDAANVAIANANPDSYIDPTNEGNFVG